MNQCKAHKITLAAHNCELFSIISKSGSLHLDIIWCIENNYRIISIEPISE